MAGARYPPGHTAIYGAVAILGGIVTIACHVGGVVAGDGRGLGSFGTGDGFWCGAIYLLAGAYTFEAGRHQTSTLRRTSLAFCILAVTVSFVQLVISFTAVVQMRSTIVYYDKRERLVWRLTMLLTAAVVLAMSVWAVTFSGYGLTARALRMEEYAAATRRDRRVRRAVGVAAVLGGVVTAAANMLGWEVARGYGYFFLCDGLWTALLYFVSAGFALSTLSGFPKGRIITTAILSIISAVAAMATIIISIQGLQNIRHYELEYTLPPMTWVTRTVMLAVGALQFPLQLWLATNAFGAVSEGFKGE